MIYLDSAATSLIKPQAVEHAVVKAMRSYASPGRGAHAPSFGAAETVFNCRGLASELFKAGSEEHVVFTCNATHALNIAIRSLIRRGGRVLISGFEHNAVTRPLNAAGAKITVAGTKLFDPEDTLRDFAAKIPSAELVVCTHVSNVFGYILPIYEIAELCRKSSVPLIIDASQSAGVLDVDQSRLNADFIAMPGHKALFGPQGTGVLICRDGGLPLLYGGSGSDSLPQEMPEYLPDRLEAGTANVCGIAGLGAGIAYVLDKTTNEIGKHERALTDCMAQSLSACGNIELFYGGGENQSGVLSVRTNLMSSEELAEELNKNQIYVRSGLHCAPYAHRSAGTLDTGTVRFSFSPFVTEKQVVQAADTVRAILDCHRQ